MTTPIDIKYMKIALRLAQKGKGYTSPNPLVGAVITKKDKIISKGYHKKIGEAHAEVEAIKRVKESLEGAKLYLNLEPCDHQGRTPPCTKAIIDSKIKEVVIAMIDPNPIVKGKGIQRLKEKGIKVKLGILEEEAKRLNEAYLYSILNKMPFVQLKLACSLDGKIFSNTLKERYLTGIESRREVHKLRREVDAIMIGKNTAQIDNPFLTTYLVKGRNPLRIVVCRKFDLSLDLNIFNEEAKTLVATTDAMNKEKVSLLKDKGIEVLWVPEKEKKIDLRILLSNLYKRGIMNILLEGGSYLATSFLKENLVNKVILYISPKILGKGIPLLRFEEINPLNLKEVSYKKVGVDLRVIGYLK